VSKERESRDGDVCSSKAVRPELDRDEEAGCVQSWITKEIAAEKGGLWAGSSAIGKVQQSFSKRREALPFAVLAGLIQSLIRRGAGRGGGRVLHPSSDCNVEKED
jgi:hypothetical protein